MQEVTRVCVWCSAPFVTTHPTAIHCSRRCKVARSNHISNAKRQAPRRAIPCEHCRMEFLAPRSDSRFCSVTCMNTWNYWQERPRSYALRCSWCDATFQWPTRRPKFCTLKCRDKARYAREADERRAATKLWAATRGKHPRFQPTVQAKFNRRRAAKVAAGGSLSTGDWRKVLTAAQGRCFYCRKRHGKLTLEHVIPLSRGGQHSLGNVVAACRSCNSSKAGSLVMEWRVRLLRSGRYLAVAA